MLGLMFVLGAATPLLLAGVAFALYGTPLMPRWLNALALGVEPALSMCMR
jgi:hypothetical protein